jgi:hypothetical protein
MLVTFLLTFHAFTLSATSVEKVEIHAADATVTPSTQTKVNKSSRFTVIDSKAGK